MQVFDGETGGKEPLGKPKRWRD